MPDVSSVRLQRQPLTIDDDDVDEVLYFARANLLLDIQQHLSALSEKHNTTATRILHSISDPYTRNTAAHYAAANGHVPILSWVKELEGDERLAVDGTASDSDTNSLFNRMNEQGSTALHYAAVNGQYQAVEVLLSHPSWAEDKARRIAYVQMRNQAGRTARDEADLQGAGREDWLKVVGLLQKQEVEEEPENAEDTHPEDQTSLAGEDEVELTTEGVQGMKTT